MCEKKISIQVVTGYGPPSLREKEKKTRRLEKKCLTQFSTPSFVSTDVTENGNVPRSLCRAAPDLPPPTTRAQDLDDIPVLRLHPVPLHPRRPARRRPPVHLRAPRRHRLLLRPLTTRMANTARTARSSSTESEARPAPAPQVAPALRRPARLRRTIRRALLAALRRIRPGQALARLLGTRADLLDPGPVLRPAPLRAEAPLLPVRRALRQVPVTRARPARRRPARSPRLSGASTRTITTRGAALRLRDTDTSNTRDSRIARALIRTQTTAKARILHRPRTPAIRNKRLSRNRIPDTARAAIALDTRALEPESTASTPARATVEGQAAPALTL